MKIKILSQKHNPLLKRQEVTFEVDHSQEGETSTRVEVRQSLAKMLKVDLDRVFVERVETKTGTTIAFGEANAYESPEQARLVEREHILARNAPPAKSEEPKPEAKPAAPKPEAAKEQAPSKPKAEEAPKPTPKPEAAKTAAPKPAAKPDTQGAKEAKEAPPSQKTKEKAPEPEAEKAVKQEE